VGERVKSAEAGCTNGPKIERLNIGRIERRKIEYKKRLNLD
jgi:hypothetical protein